MITLYSHPFNEEIGLGSIRSTTKTLILGSFPAHEVVVNDNPRMYFYYGSRDNLFWDLLKDSIEPTLPINDISLLRFLDDNGIGIIDIVKSCYRKSNSSSIDEELSIVQLQDILKILVETNIDTILATSNFVRKLFRKQVFPFFDKQNREVQVHSQGNYEYELIKFIINGSEKPIKFITLLSPSPNALRGIQKGINKCSISITAEEYRKQQYRIFLSELK